MKDLVKQAHMILEAINARDVETVVANLDPAYEATWPHGTLDLHHATLHELTMLEAFPDLTFQFVNTVASGSTVLVEVLAVGTHSGPLVLPGESTIPPSGASLLLPMALVLQFANEKLRFERLYFDQLSMLRQVGAR